MIVNGVPNVIPFSIPDKTIIWSNSFLGVVISLCPGLLLDNCFCTLSKSNLKFDGGASISRTARPYPSWLIFKPAMFLTSFLLIKYWLNNKIIIYD